MGKSRMDKCQGDNEPGGRISGLAKEEGKNEGAVAIGQTGEANASTRCSLPLQYINQHLLKPLMPR